jgi:hypothetical protein
MPRRLAACVSLVVFAVCLLAGARAGNSFSTTVWRAVMAMGGTVVVGLIVGSMAQAMVEENVARTSAATEPPADVAAQAAAEKTEKSPANRTPVGR